MLDPANASFAIDGNAAVVPDIRPCQIHVADDADGSYFYRYSFQNKDRK